MKQERAPTVEYLGEAPRRVARITVWTRVPSVNVWNNKKNGWRIYQRVRDEWLTRLSLAINGKVCFKKARVTAQRFACRSLDAGNANDGLKPIVDNLVRLGLIEDDKPENMPEAPTCWQSKVSKRADERTVLIIEELQ